MAALIAQIEALAPLDLTPSKAKVLVNVYGSKDILKDFSIGDQSTPLNLVGEKTNIAGYSTGDRNKPLVNIEILGASHTDYVRRNQVFDFDNAGIFGGVLDIWDSLSSEQEKWNATVAEFTAEIALHSKSEDDIELFLKNSGYGKEDPIGSNNWVVTLPGLVQ